MWCVWIFLGVSGLFPFVCFNWPRLWFQHPCVSSSSTRNLPWSSNHSIPDCFVVDLAPKWNAQCLLLTHVDPLLVFTSVVCCSPDTPPPSFSATATTLPSRKFLWPVIPAHSISELSPLHSPPQTNPLPFATCLTSVFPSWFSSASPSVCTSEKNNKFS